LGEISNPASAGKAQNALTLATLAMTANRLRKFMPSFEFMVGSYAPM
jgi:hypothetical protein